jgi:CRISPR-associated protein Cmr6
MAAPLYQGLNMPKQCQGHYGLWFERLFNQYSPHNWEFADSTQKSAWLKEFHNKLVGSKENLASHAQSQLMLSQRLQGKALSFKALGHFVTGMGNPHPVENGFAWHPTLGVPYLTGAAVKGMVRSYLDCNLELDETKKKALLFSWFGSTSKNPSDEDYAAQAGNLIFFDAVPMQPVKLGVDIMTPHMGKWYAEGAKKPNTADTVPADWHDPNPIAFLVAHDIRLLFSFALRPSAPQKAKDSISLDEVAYVLEQALLYAGAGAKTATGYGGFTKAPDLLMSLQQIVESQQKNQAEQRANAEKAAQKDAYLASLSPLESELEQLEHVSAWIKALESGHWKEDAIKEAAQAIKQRMQALKKWAEPSKAKKPEKDKDYQATLVVLKYLK